MMSNTTDLKQLNISSILSVLYRKKELTKTEIAKHICSSSVTSHNLINELKAEGVVIETGNFLHGAGRKATKYKLNESYALSIGVRFFRRSLQTTVYDFSLNCIYENVVEWDMHNVTDCLKTLKVQLNCAIQTVKNKKILGIGVSIPGRLNENGVILEIPDRPKWNGLNIKKEIEQETGFSAYIDNDVNAQAISVKWANMLNNCDNFAYLCIDDGTGVGIIINGQIFHGRNYFGAEIGHLTVVNDGRKCECGKKGCLQAYTSSSALISWFKSIDKKVNNSFDICALYNQNDRETQNILNTFCNYVALGIEYLIRAFDTEKIIVQSSILSQLPELFDKIRTKVANNLSPRKNIADIILNDANKSITQSSPCCLVMNNFYNSY